jgi:hypothetical protein
MNTIWLASSPFSSGATSGQPRAPLTPRRVLNSLRRSRPWAVKVESSCAGYRTSFEQFPTLDAAGEALQRWSERLAEPRGA